MKTKYPNQKKIIVHREQIEKGKQKPFLTVYLENIKEASKNLSGEVAFKLYLYCLSNQDNYDFDYSPQHFAAEYGVSVDRARKAVNELISCGYWVNEGANNYHFYELPQNTSRIAILTEKRKVPQDDGTFRDYSYKELYDELNRVGYSDVAISEFWNKCEVE